MHVLSKGKPGSSPVRQPRASTIRFERGAPLEQTSRRAMHTQWNAQEQFFTSLQQNPHSYNVSFQEIEDKPFERLE
eukprot:6460237-Amphidinium_carterae.1